MKFLRACGLGLLAFVFFCTRVQAEGFAMQEWSARGLGMAGSVAGMADDVSALAYNAAGITQLPGVNLMGGGALVAPLGTVKTERRDGAHYTTTKPKVWFAPHAYASYQLNDNVWLGLGAFSRFGLGNSYDGEWNGRYNVYDIGVQTLSFVPTLAYKINNMFSVSAGLEVMYASLYMGTKIPMMSLTQQGMPGPLQDNDMQLQGDGWGYGAHLGLHMRLNDQWSVGLAYKSQVTLNVSGDVEFSRQGQNLLTNPGRFSSVIPKRHLPEARNTDAHTTIQLPDSAALGIAWKPLDNLSLEADVMWTRWSTYNALNIYMDSGYSSINNKEWRDGWSFSLGAEYKPLDWWALRAGFRYETPVVNEEYADYMIPTNGRQMLTLGTGVKWNDFTLDFAYVHIWVNPVDYGSTRSSGIRGDAGITGGRTENVVGNIYMLSLGYAF
ncbi:MAG: OmpP1/FadL family transporter [Desulfovibrio sp.]|jgi:long-chain fatty acid transport protein|nr:OmpP1/FadL family transporter [Desulfovibrio sp.]